MYICDVFDTYLIWRATFDLEREYSWCSNSNCLITHTLNINHSRCAYFVWHIHYSWSLINDYINELKTIFVCIGTYIAAETRCFANRIRHADQTNRSHGYKYAIIYIINSTCRLRFVRFLWQLPFPRTARNPLSMTSRKINVLKFFIKLILFLGFFFSSFFSAAHFVRLIKKQTFALLTE